MSQVVLLNNIDHHDLRLNRSRGASNGETINQVRVFPTEFKALQREYPIFFRRDDDGAYQAVAILGLDRDENLYLENDGDRVVWDACYIPAVLDRGPFSIGLGQQSDGQGYMIMVDLDHPWISRTEGEPLFLTHGGNSRDLDTAAATLRTLHQGVESERAMFAAYEQAGLLAYLDVNIRLDESTEYKLPGLYTLRPDVLRDLDGDIVQTLNRNGFLELAFYVMASHDNLKRLVDKKNARRTAY